MKKILAVFLAIFGLFAVAGCKNEDPAEVKQEIKIILPSGAPLMTQVGLYDKAQGDDFTLAGHKVSITVVPGPDPLKAAYGSESHDIIVSPINMGAAMFKNGKKYKLAASISDGNIAIASTTKITKFEDLKNMNLVAFGKGNINSLAFTEVLKKYEITNEVTYLSSVKDIVPQLVADKNPNTAYLIAEPALSGARAKLKKEFNKEVYTLDLLKEFEEKIGVPFLQSGIFVKEGTPTEFLNAYLEEIKAYITEINTEGKKLSSLTAKYPDLGFPPAPVLEKAIKGCHLNYRKSSDCKELIKGLANLNLKYFGGEVPSEEFYL